MKQITVVGVGYVGLVTGTCLADLGNRVVCLDINEERIEGLKQGIMPIYEPGLEEMVRRNVKAGRLSFTTSYEEALREAEFVFIAVGTPEGVDGEADLRYVRMAARSIAEVMDHPMIIVNKSTVPVGTGDWVADIIRENQAKPIPFSVVSNPEFLREGSAINDFMYPDRIVLGSLDREAAEKVAQLYLPLRAPIMITDLRTAEMIKYASNAFLATRISFINEIANICEALGADVREVAVGMGYDKRIGPYFLDAGIGYGGSCFAGDTTVFALNGHRVVARPFEELVAGEGEAVQAGTVEIVTPRQVSQVLAFDLTTGRATLADVRCFTRRWYEGPMVTLRTRMGRRLRVTADHPVVLYDPTAQGFRIVLADQVQAGDRLVAATTLPDLEQPTAVDLIEALAESPLEAEVKVRPYDDAFTRTYSQFARYVPSALMKHRYEIKRKNYMPLPVYRHLRTHGHLDLSSERLRLFTTKGRPTYCPAQFPVDEDFMRLLGYYVAEGWISKDVGRNGRVRERVGFSFGVHEQEYIADLHRILQRYGIRYLEKREGRSHATLISSKPLAYLLRDLLQCGTRSEDKRLPKLVFHVSEPLKLAFLQGAWSGDGAITKLQEGRNLMYEYATVSKPLAEGMALLLQSLGIVPSIRRRWMNKSTQEAYILRISGVEQVERLQALFGAERQIEIQSLLDGYERRIAQSGFRRREAFVTLEVTDVQIEPSAEYVYSLETTTGTLLTASGLVAHNCFPKDVKALAYMATVHGQHPQLLHAVMEINQYQRRKVIFKLRELLGSLKNKVVGLLGLSFKPNTDDMREAPSLSIARMLLSEGAVVRAYDPVAMPNARKLLPDVQLADDPYEMAEGCDALVVVTDWNEFKQLDMERIRDLMRRPVLIDGRNIYDPARMRALGFQYRGIGRGYYTNEQEEAKVVEGALA